VTTPRVLPPTKYDDSARATQRTSANECVHATRAMINVKEAATTLYSERMHTCMYTST